MKVFDRIVAALIMLLGAIHSASFVFRAHFDEAGMWFLSGGLMMIFLGLINLVRSTTPGDIPRAAALTANAFSLMFAVWLVPLYLPLRQNPQVAVLLTLVVAATLFSVMGPDPKSELPTGKGAR